MPRFSVIIPVFNDPEGLSRAIESVLLQSDPDFELLIVDDGSTPRAQAPSDPRIHVRRFPSPGGPARARNAGLALARGQYVAFLDSDDTYGVQRLEHAAAAHRAGADLVVCNGTIDPGTQRVELASRRYLDGFTPNLGRVSIARSHCLSFDERFLACEDIDWWCRLDRSLVLTEIADHDHEFVGTDHERILNSPNARLAFSYLLIERHPNVYFRGSDALTFRLLRIAELEMRYGSTKLSRRACRMALSSGLQTRSFRQLAHVATRRQAARLRIGSEPLPPIPTSRARQYRPFEVGSAESAVHFEDPLTRYFIRSAPLMPKALRLRTRAAVWRLRRKRLRPLTSFGHFPMLSATAVHIAPFVREPLETEVFARMITPGSLVVDIGANNGWYTLVAAARVGRDGRVLAFEPDPRSSDSIRSLIAANQLESRVNLHAEAVGAERRLQMLHLTPDPAKSYRELGEVDPRAEGVEVDVYPASDLWREPGFSTGAVMKVDTEGAEQLVLNALLEAAPLAAKLPIIMFEFVPSQYDRAGASATSLVQDLLNRGYCLYRIDYTAGGLTPWGAHAGTATARNLVAIPSALEVEVLARVHGGFAPSEVSRE